MPTPKKTTTEHQPQRRRDCDDDRDRADDRPHKRGDYVAGADGESEVDASAADETVKERPEKNGTGW